MRKKVVLIGWDAADWNIINPLLSEGKMPALAGLIKKGVRGNLQTMNPPYSPMLWTSVATGKTADKHGVLGFIEIESEQQIVRPVTVTQRKVRAIWNILNAQGMKSNLIGWWPSHPAEPINGVVVADNFPKVVGLIEEPWPLVADTVHPKELAESLKDLRVHPEELTAAHILPFIPRAKELEGEHRKSLNILRKIVAHNSTLHACSTWAMENTEWDFTAVYYDLIDHFCHAFMRFYPPKLPPVQENIYEIFKHAIDGAYMFQDMMLERTLKLAGDDALVIVMSDHGYVSGNERVLVPPDIHAAPALEHREFGMFVMSGPGVKKHDVCYGTSLLDIAPTILNYFGLPIGRDMDGRALQDPFEHPTKPKMIDSWENEPGDFGEHTEAKSGDPFNEQAAMEQLIELGYIDRPDADIEKAIKATKSDLKFNLARVYLGKQDYDSSEKLLRELIEESEKSDPYMVDLINISLIKEDFAEARKFLELLRSKNENYLSKTQLVEAKILMGEGKVKKAREVLQNLSKRPSMVGKTEYELGKLYMRLDEFEKAKEHFQKAVEFQPDQAKYQHGLALAYLRLGNAEMALDHALNSVELVRYFPDAHYTVGQALEQMGDMENAKQAYATAELLQPKMKRAKMAHENLENKEAQKNPVDKRDLSQFPLITVVSGLPRSGTSMMMQMLSAGGADPLVDGVRKDDENNPKGYFEYEKTKRLHKTNDWLHEAEGKVIKVVAPLLKFLPPDFRYKIVFMTRDLDEVLASQDKMIGKKAPGPQTGIRASFERELKQLDQRLKNEPGMEVIKVPYADVIDNPRGEAEKINAFLGNNLDVDKMVEQVEAKLYRNRVLKF